MTAISRVLHNVSDAVKSHIVRAQPSDVASTRPYGAMSEPPTAETAVEGTVLRSPIDAGLAASDSGAKKDASLKGSG